MPKQGGQFIDIFWETAENHPRTGNSTPPSRPRELLPWLRICPRALCRDLSASPPARFPAAARRPLTCARLSPCPLLVGCTLGVWKLPAEEKWSGTIHLS